MAIADLVKAVMADVAVYVPDVTWRVGERWAQTHEDAPPRVVWAPQEDRFDGPWNISENPRQLLSCFTRFAVHVWGAGDDEGSFAPTEALKNVLLASIYRVAHGYFTLGKGTWASEDGRIADAGGLYLLEVTLGIPITDVALAEATVTGVTTTGTALMPGGNVSTP